MPLLEHSSFPGAPFYQFNGHLQTLIPGIRRKVKGISFERERIDTPDGDFLDLDWIRTGNNRLLILSHGLEGDSSRQYIRGTAKIFNQNGWDVLAWNCRSCSGEMNRAFRMYHHGDTDDIHTVVQHAARQYPVIALAGYSMGANISMNYLGKLGEAVPSEVKVAAVFSAPCDIDSASDILDRWENVLYRTRFMKALQDKVKRKALQYPDKIDVTRMKDIRRWRDFDEWFSAPICGFRDADEFYYHASSKNFIEGIRRPTLLVNAKNDPILTPACFPENIARDHAFFHLEQPREGGHCGFQTRNGNGTTWAEQRALEFCQMHVSDY